MLHEDWLPLQESDIQALATRKVFERGRALFDDDALEDLLVRSDDLSASCLGSEEELYLLSARINESGVQETRCSCPYEYDGLCKHRVALLLAWAHTPERFRVFDDSAPNDGTTSHDKKAQALFRELQSREHHELVRLVIHLVETEPKLRAIVRQQLRNRLSDGEIAKVQRAVAAHMKKIVKAADTADFSRVRRELVFQVRNAASLEALRPADAGELYMAVIKGLMMAGSDPFNWDNSRVLVGISQQCVAAITPLLPQVPRPQRVQWIKTLCEAYIFDLRLGGYGFVQGAEGILENADTEEWSQIEPQLDSFLQSPAAPRCAEDRDSEWLHLDEWGVKLPPDIYDWERSEALALKAKRLEKTEGQHAAINFLAVNGTPGQQVEAYLTQGNLDQATHLARQHFLGKAGLIYSFADKLNQMGEWERAREWAQQNNLSDWLAHHSAERGEADALELNLELFRSAPTSQGWFRVLELTAVNSREKLKAELWDFLEDRGAFATQFDIRLGEGNIGAALKIWPKLNPWEQQHRREHLAVAAESASNENGILLWSELAELWISHRSRDAYRLAVKCLVRVKRLLEKEGRGSDWALQSASLRERYPLLRALKEEMDRAKL